MSEQMFSVPRGRNHSIDQGDLRGSPPKRFPYGSTSSDEDEEDVQHHSDEDSDDEYSRDSISDFSQIRLDGEDSQLPPFAEVTASTSAPSVSDTNVDSEARGQKREAEDPQPTNRKRTFSNAGPEAQPSGSGEKRTATKICRVCGDKSYSYNFNVITRNAHKEKELRCPFNDNCDINIVSRRFCQRCRLKKSFAVGMKKEWIMSEEARLEKKQRIQDNRERRAAEKAQQDKMANENAQSSMSNLAMDTTMMPATNSQSFNQPLPSSIPASAPLLPALVGPSVNPPLPVASAILQQTVQLEAPNSMALHAQVLAAAASQPLPIVPSAAPVVDPIEQQIAAAQVAQIAASVQPPTANLNNAQVAQLAQAAQVAQAAQAVQAMQQQVQLEQQAQIAAQVHQQIAAQVAAQRLQATADLVAAVPAISAQTAADIVAATQPANVTAAAAVLSAAQSASAQSTISAALMAPTMTPPAPVASFSIVPAPLVDPSPPVAPVSLPPVQLVSSPLQPAPSQEMVTVPKAVLTAIVQENIENRQAQQQNAQAIHPPLKCVCKCQCGRYPSDLVIVDVVHRDMLNDQPLRAVERMDCQQVDADCCLMSDADRAELNAILQANAFWAIPNEPVISANESATDSALRRLIRFTSRLNGFRSLSRPDQAALLKNGCASHFTIRSAMTLNENGGWSPQNAISDTVVQFFNSLREEWRTNESIMLLLGLLAIFDPATPNVENKALIEHESAKYKSILKRLLYTLCAQSQQRCCAEYEDLLNKLHVLQSLNNSTIVSPANGLVDSLRWSAEVVEPLLRRELFEPQLLNNVAVDSVTM